MRRGLRAAAAKGADAAKREVMGDPPGHSMSSVTRQSTGLRAGLASGTKVAIRTGRESASGVVSGEGVRVSATGTKLPTDKQPMVKAYMAREFRHPVFGRGTYVTQRGKNWFYGPLMQGRGEYQRAIVEAIELGLEAIAKD
jgi:hypothetical protein